MTPEERRKKVVHRPPITLHGGQWTLSDDGVVLKDDQVVYANWVVRDIRRIGNRLVAVGFSGKRYILHPDTGRAELWT